MTTNSEKKPQYRVELDKLLAEMDRLAAERDDMHRDFLDAMKELDRLKAEILTAASIHLPTCEVKRWATKTSFGPPARCSCVAAVDETVRQLWYTLKSELGPGPQQASLNRAVDTLRSALGLDQRSTATTNGEGT